MLINVEVLVMSMYSKYIFVGWLPAYQVCDIYNVWRK
jgi:hypothetical protein